jgi:hypothetical protein
MPNIQIDPTKPLAITGTFDTPLRIHAEISYRHDPAAAWTTLLSVNVSEDSPNQVLTATVPLPAKGSSVLISAVFAGAPKTPYQATIVFSQNGASVGAPIVWSGSTGTDMTKFEQAQVDLS